MATEKPAQGMEERRQPVPPGAPVKRRRLFLLGRSGPRPLARAEEAPLNPEQCLNCGALVAGKYCAECGQEHSHKTVSLGRLIAEFLDDTLSLDSKLLKTTVLLLVRPGYLTNEYNAGRRVRYLSPWRIYVFTSVLLFFLLSLKAPPLQVDVGVGLMPRSLQAEARADVTLLTWTGGEEAASFKVKRAESADGPYTEIAEDLKTPRFTDATAKRQTPYYYTVTAVAEDGRRATSDPLRALPATSSKPVVSHSEDHMLDGEIQLGNRRVKLSELPDTVEDYEAAQRSLPPGQRDGWYIRTVVSRAIEYRNMGMRGLTAEWTRGLIENAPKAMFVLLPMFALLLKVIYIRRQRLYIEHLVFALHTHAFLYTLLCVEFLLWGRYGGLVFGLAVLYLYVAMRVVYRQSYAKTLAKFGLLLLSYSMVLGFGLVGVVLLTLLTG